MEQLNKIVEAMEYASDAYWGNPQRYQFQARIDQFNTTTEIKENDERVIRASFDIKLYGYLIPDTIQKDLSSLKKFNNKCKLIFSLETDVAPEVFIPGTVVDDLGTNEIVNPETADNVRDPRDLLSDSRYGQ
jgi:hypothetical protein